MSGALTQGERLSAAPILDAVERYRGVMVDLDKGTTLRPDAFHQGREALTLQLRQQGLEPGDKVLVALPNGPGFVAMLAAVLACDASPLLLHFKTPTAELQRYAMRFGVRFLATEASQAADCAEIEKVSTSLTFGDEVLHWGQLAIDLDALTGPTLRGVPLHPTSGSTGLPKLALRPGFAAMEEARHYAETMQITAEDCIAAIPPMSHAYGYGMSVMTPLLTGASIVSTSRFSVKLLHQALLDHPLTIVPSAPAMLELLSYGAGDKFRRLRWLLAAGSMLPRRASEIFREATGVVVCPLYGTTETGGISVSTIADGNETDGRVGPAMNGVEVEVWPHPDGERLGPDIGKLHVRSSSMMLGYLDDDGNILQPLEDGWFETGDLARLDDDGAIVLRGRNSELINVAGLKVTPCEVEEAIAAMPGVKEVKAYAGEHRTGTQIVKVAVAVEGAIDEMAIRQHCVQQLVYYKRPQQVTIVDALPRSPTGKILPDQLP
ncbi:class I adenylate-forming enzyme family protein [Lignipirellula cremea]|uniref:Long-chain-fatty-acid--CoA ligase n=1 Tax=Lignipirellula cremea TaxID=2528010 RepID=A0A518DL33_9BACT|nr:class I adenylate-forming enzyme family protein [Lignipirellula cremea]QDU92549.1 Long-chain-fatty-acid--CoA ligase [Lignipirellula cremea]